MDTRPEPTGPFGTKILQSNISVLLVDDNRVNQFLGKRILKNLGISNVELAGNGEDAFHLVKTNHYDVLLTDVEMPGMNGYELSKAIREFETSKKRITIIALTANASDDDRLNAQEAGIDDYLTKPYSPHDLQEVLQKHLGAKNNVLLEDIQPTFNPEHNSGIHQLYAVFHQNRDDVRHFLHMLSGQIPELVDQIKEGMLKGNIEQAFQYAIYRGST
jgi:CheY-like chemotaxis protein